MGNLVDHDPLFRPLLPSAKVLAKSFFAGVFKRKGANAPANESASLLPSARIAA